MKDTLIKLLGLEAKATDDQVVAAVKALADNAAAAKAVSDKEGEINKLIGASAGALDRKRAEQVLANRASFAATQPKTKKK